MAASGQWPSFGTSRELDPALGTNRSTSAFVRIQCGPTLFVVECAVLVYEIKQYD